MAAVTPARVASIFQRIARICTGASGEADAMESAARATRSAMS